MSPLAMTLSMTIRAPGRVEAIQPVHHRAGHVRVPDAIVSMTFDYVSVLVVICRLTSVWQPRGPPSRSRAQRVPGTSSAPSPSCIEFTALPRACAGASIPAPDDGDIPRGGRIGPGRVCCSVESDARLRARSLHQPGPEGTPLLRLNGIAYSSTRARSSRASTGRSARATGSRWSAPTAPARRRS